MDSQATMRKELMVLLEDRTKGIKTSLSTDIDILKEHFKAISARLRKLEDSQSGGGELEEIRQQLTTVNNYNVKVGQRMADLSKTIEAAKIERIKDQETISERISQQIAHTTATVDADRQARERDSRRLDEALRSQGDDAEALVQSTKHELERVIDTLGTQTSDRFGDVKQEIDLGARNLKDTTKRLESKVADQVFMLKKQVGEDIAFQAAEQIKRTSVIEDKLHQLNQTVERNVESSSLTIRKIHDELGKERLEREQFEESMMRLVDDQLVKVHMSIERHPNVEAE